MGPDDVFEYAKKLRAAGVEEVDFDGGVITHVRLAVAAPDPVSDPVRPLTEEERKHVAREKKRKRLSIELGFVPDDNLMDRLP